METAGVQNLDLLSSVTGCDLGRRVAATTGVNRVSEPRGASPEKRYT
jgi:hypothetical protein